MQNPTKQAEIQSLYQKLKQQKKLKNWSDTLNTLFPAYTHLKRITGNWMTPDSLEDKTHEVCRCRVQHPTMQEVDLIDLMGQRQVKLPFFSCMPDAVQILARGYLASTPVYPQTSFLLRLLNFYHLLWNLSNATTLFRRSAPPMERVIFCQAMQQEFHPGENSQLAHNLSGSIEVYQLLVTKQQTLVETITSTSKQDLLAQKHFLHALGQPFPVLTLPNHATHTTSSFALMEIFSKNTTSSVERKTVSVGN
ncbi:hypothetical protein VP01_1254g1 [Puccinia sorghi]|uniref:CxC1-like cysteine cluster associated with KDZ transposases domain-containing protein n=1 Tax=Puccinia sorghi TaxID=27349 RepID=A0A0L6VQU5_9BASI|nr:hypothetical protein VP01_1254g1 [Puccinia sorghi]